HGGERCGARRGGAAMRRMAVLMAVAFIDMIGLMMVLPLMPLYAKSLHANPTMVGILVASFSVAQLASSPVWGRVSDRYGRRPVLLVGLTASAIVNVLFAGRWLPESRVLPTHTPTASGHMAPPPEPRPVKAAIWDVIQHPGRPVARMIWIYAVAMLAYTATPPIFALYLSWRFGITARNIGYFFVIFGAVGVLM